MNATGECDVRHDQSHSFPETPAGLTRSVDGEASSHRALLGLAQAVRDHVAMARDAEPRALALVERQVAHEHWFITFVIASFGIVIGLVAFVFFLGFLEVWHLRNVAKWMTAQATKRGNDE